MTENEIAKIVVDAAIKVHRALGPGLLESVYEIVLAHGLAKRWDEESWNQKGCKQFLAADERR